MSWSTAHYNHIITLLLAAILMSLSSGYSSNSVAPPITRDGSDTSAVGLAQLSVIPAFPGAEGWGAMSVGGRGGKILEVTNLNDAGPGSLRDCVEVSGPRICVFRVAGTIALNSQLRITKPFITIAGQTAPGDGITIQDFGFEISTNNVIMRYLRWRGPAFQFIAIRATHDTHDIIVDHCSASWHADAGVGSGTTIGIWYNDEQRTDPVTSEI